MRYRFLGNSGIEVSVLSLGTMLFGGSTTESESKRLVDAALDRGINNIDTADIYGKGLSEVAVGKCISGKRDKVILSTKCGRAMAKGPNGGGASRRHIIQACNDSLNRLKVDYIDIYYLHCPDPDTGLDESLYAFDILVRSGKVRYLGLSNFPAWQVCMANGIASVRGFPSVSVVQPLYNILNRDAELELFSAIREQRIGAITYSPIARGVLTGKYDNLNAFPAGSRAASGDKRICETELRPESLRIVSSLTRYCGEKGYALSRFAIAWALENRAVTSIIIGPRTIEQLHDNLDALAIQFTDEDERAVDALVPPGGHSDQWYRDPQYPLEHRRAPVGNLKVAP